MEQKNRQPQWDIYEAVILLDGYLETVQKKEPKTHIIKRISDDLRTMAVNRGIHIDSIYRNENGISYQLQSMESAFLGRKVYVPATRLFVEAVRLYRDEHEKYLDVLGEAKRMVASKPNNKEAFLAWAAADITSRRSKWLESNILRVEQVGINAKLFTGSIFDLTDIETLERLLKAISNSKIFRIKNKKFYNQILDDFSLYIRYCLQIGEPEESASVSKSVHEDTDSAGVVSTTVSQDTGGFMLVDFYNIDSMTFTKPITLVYKGISYACKKWGSLYVDLVSKMCGEYPEVFLASVDNTVFHSEALMIASENRKNTLRMPRSIGGGYYIEGNCSATRIVKNIRSFLDLCKVDYSQVSIKYCRTTDQEQEDKSTFEKAAEPLADSGIVKVLRQHYQYGFRYESIRELMRFRQFAVEMNIEIPDDDDLLKAAILASGTLIDDKVYCKNDDLPDELRSLVSSVFDTGAEVIYYECLFHRETEWMASHVITSESMLKEYLQKHVRGCSFSKKFFVKGKRLTEKEAVTAEIKRVWGNQQTESVEILSDRLPFIPLGNIWRVISGNELFVLSSEGVYVLLDRLHITEDEEEDILDYVRMACDQNGFASLSDVPLGDIEEENYEMSQLAIYNAIYKKVLSHKYHLNGKILTTDKPELDAITLLKKYIAGRDTCSFDEVADKVIELTGGSNRQYAFQALYDNMVRTGPNSFVANGNVNFNVEEIDKILSGFITDHFLAIRDITTFAMFPIAGQNWNHYLLESYCYKYSRKYTLHVLHFNDKNAGIIAEKDYNQQYTEMLAIALARADVELSPEVAGPYLFNAGYMAKSKYARLGEIVQRAKDIRGKR